MTGKRQIPINNHEPPRGATPGGGAHPGPANAGAPGAATQAVASSGAPAGAEADPRGGVQADLRGGVHHGQSHAGKTAGAADLQTLQAELDGLAADLERLASERDALCSERDELADSRLRLQAEFDNYRRRATRESFETRDRAQCDLLTDLLPVLDNLERALDAAEHHEEGKVLGGVRMTRDMFVDLLARTGVEEVAGVGAQFDPQVHEAISVQPSEHEEGVVAAVLERGYRQGERVLRPARVVVSAGRGRDSRGGSGAGSGGGV
ncbi:MAG: nucleotide exchange factor GrpE [Thermoleophilia bacterium]|nr:nucleotide exchange factor GrpE [Thermoleophilia bacterium]